MADEELLLESAQYGVNAVRSETSDLRNTPPPSLTGMRPGVNTPSAMITGAQYNLPRGIQGQSKYSQLLAVLEEMGKDIRPTYANTKSSNERLKRHIVTSRILVRECLMECERAART